MSLRIWLPLNGTLDNQGLDDVVITNNGATIDNNGKIGKCYSFDGNDDYISLNGNALYNIIKGGSNPFSFTMWIYHADNSRAILFGDYSLSGGINFNIELNASHSVRFYWGGAPDTSGSHTLVTQSGWTHIAIVYNGADIKFYKNGILTDTYIGTLTIKNKNSGDYYLGRDARTGTTALNGKINDFRIYDHALSPLEVKHIAQGLILHYPLNRGGWGQENLLPCGGTYTQSSPWTTTLNRTDGYAFVTNSGFEATPGKTYTISVECDGNLYSAHGGTHNPSDKHWTFWAYISNINTTANWQNGGYDTPRNLTSSNNNYRKIGNTHVWTITLTDSQKYIGLRTNSYSNGTDNVTIKWWNMKVEEGDTFTGWSPNSSSELGELMNLNSTIEYDTSGFHNNGTRTGTFSWTSDTPKYQVSTKFNTTSTKIKLPVISFTGMANSYTFAWWQYNISTGNMPWGFSDGNRLNCYHCSPLCWNTGDGSSNQFKDGSTTVTPATIQNGWHHMVITGDGTATKLYIDGVYKGTAITYKPLTGTQIWISGWDSGTLYTFNGSKECDFRIYATALSADDVKSLYQNSAYIDNQGNIYGAVYEEV